MSASIGPSGRGAVATFVVILTLVSVVAGMGTGAAAYVSVNRVRDRVGEVIGATTVWTMLVGAGGLVLAWLADSVGLPARWFGASGLGLEALIAVGVGGQYLATTTLQVLTGQGRVRATAAGFLVVPILGLGGNLVAGLTDGGTSGFLVVQALAPAVGGAMLLGLVGAAPRVGAAGIRALAASGRRAWPGDVANILSYRLDVLLLGVIT
ncbi:MAG: hypothetical protein HY262_02790, partial [Chloroflexi bacterium]|nr:hypothetical protein [Chloroflexota bacterium]